MSDAIVVKAPLDINTIEYLNKILKIGTKYRLQKFEELSEREKSKIICLSCLRQLVRSVLLDECAIKIGKNCVEIYYTVPISISGRKNQERVRRETTARSKVLSLEPIGIEDGNLVFELKLDPREFQEDTLISRVGKHVVQNMKDIIFSIPKTTKKVLEKVSQISYWAENIPKEIKFYESALLRDFFTVLKELGISDIDGNQVIAFKRIYHNAEKLFPLFNSLDVDKKIKAINMVVDLTVIAESNKKEIDVFVMATKAFKIIKDNRLHEIINFNGRVNYLVDECIEKRENTKTTKFFRYYYLVDGDKKIYFSLQPYDLWRRLATTAIEDSGDEQ